MTLFEITTKGGWVMIPIALCSIIAVVIVIERFMMLSRSKTNTRHLMMKLKSLILKGSKEEAITLCDETPGPAARVLREGLIRSHRDKEEIKDTIESAGKQEIYQLERYLGILATVAGVAPLIGFLGTVTGMIRAFMQIERLSGNVNASVLAGGIWEALITTAAGLIVGIFAFLFYNYLVTNVRRFVNEIESSSNELLDLLLEEKQSENLYQRR